MTPMATESTQETGFPLNRPPQETSVSGELPSGFQDFFLPLHRRFAPRQATLLVERHRQLDQSHGGEQPTFRPPSEATTGNWRIDLPEWCRDQRNQMTGPADEAELVVKMLNSGAPGVMLDLEDSTVNDWEHQRLGAENVLAALAGTLTFFDKKRDRVVGIAPGKAVIWIRPRGLHIHQAGIVKNELTSASLFDVARITFSVDAAKLSHPLCFYIPKSESAEEALWWRDVFQAIAEARGWPSNYIKCMALVESHPLAFQAEEFLYNLRDHILGLNLGRWDYMASLIHFCLNDPAWVLPDRNTIPHDVPFFQNLRERLPQICHSRGALAIGGMTALYPSRTDAKLNSRALKALATDKQNEAHCGMDGAWTGHPDQNQIAIEQFPAPNQLNRPRERSDQKPHLRPAPTGVGEKTIAGTRAAIRTVIRYRNGVLNGKGASLLDGYMEDLATDRIYRLMIKQRMLHPGQVVDESGTVIDHSPARITQWFDEELERLLADKNRTDAGTPETLRRARVLSEYMVSNGEFNPS